MIKKLFITVILLASAFATQARDVDLDAVLAKARQGDVVAMNRAGELTMMGLYHEQRFKDALAWFEKAAQAGSTDALVNIGKMHADGYGFAQDPVKAVAYFQQAADAKNPRGMYELSGAYRSGEGVQEDRARATALLAECAALGDENCEMLLQFLSKL